MNMKSKILAVLLILSILGNIYLISLNQPEQRTAYLESGLNSTPAGLQGFAALQAPAVMQRIEYIQDYPFERRQVVEEGNMINISAEIRPGKGRVLVETRPLMGTVFQDAANTAVYAARKKTGIQLLDSDVIFSIDSRNEIPSVDGPSAGALMTLLVISALEHKDLKNDVTLTGTIDQSGHVGAVGGIVEKAKAAKQSGKTLFLLPGENSMLVQYIEKTRKLAGVTITRKVPETIDARRYIEANVGINVEYVNNIDDVLNYAMESDIPGG